MAASAICALCAEPLRAAPLTICGKPGRSSVYASSAAECDFFDTAATAFDQQIREWMTPVNSSTPAAAAGLLQSAGTSATVTASDYFPECRAALEVFFCAQHQVFRVDDDGGKLNGPPSECSAYRRPYRDHGQCATFCPPIKDACPPAAHAYCEERCRSESDAEYCEIIEVSGLDSGKFPRSLWNEDTLDIQNLYRLEAEAEKPILRTGRPSYRSIPARRPPGSSRINKLDYHLYATNVRGYTEWLLDRDERDTNGAAAVVSDGNLVPYRINSDWSVWSPEREEWAAVSVHVRCMDTDAASSSAPAGRSLVHFGSSRFRLLSAPYHAAAATAWSLTGMLTALAVLHAAIHPLRWRRRPLQVR